MAEIGETLKRRRKLGDGRDTIRLVGVSTAGWVAEAVEEFGPAFVVTADALVSEYGSRAPSLPPSEAEILREADRARTTEARLAYGRRFARRGKQPTSPPKPPAGSPEAHFAAAEEGRSNASDGTAD